jgi:hypothetical protein
VLLFKVALRFNTGAVLLERLMQVIITVQDLEVLLQKAVQDLLAQGQMGQSL